MLTVVYILSRDLSRGLMPSADSTLVKVGAMIREARDQAGLLQDELAKKAGLSRVYVSLLESDKREPSLSVFVAIAGALGISASKLLARCEKANSPKL